MLGFAANPPWKILAHTNTNGKIVKKTSENIFSVER